MMLDEQSELVLWGFGIFLGDDETGGLFIGRFGFAPRILKVSRLDLPITESEQLPPNRPPVNTVESDAAARMTRRIVDWIIDYELWVEKQCGHNWRRQCLADWEKAKLTAAEVREGWARLQESMTGLQKSVET